MKPKLIVLTGPTAVGKTGLSIKLAKAVDGEIISADSMQVYKRMDIGSAKIRSEEMEGIPHHLIDVLEPTEDFNVFVFQRLAKEALLKIYSQGHIPIVTGGTGFYIQALLYDINFSEEDNTEIRKRLTDEAQKLGKEVLYERLRTLDPDYAMTVHPNNVKKVIRALEYIELNNKPFSVHNMEEKAKESPYEFSYFVLNDKRDILYQRIDKRVDLMIEDGLVDEVKELKALGLDRNAVSMQGLGYKEILDYLDGLYSLEDAIEKVKLETRRYAKRQLTYFRHEREPIWIDKNEFSYDDEKILDFMLKETGLGQD